MTPARNNGSLGGTPLQQLPTPGSVKMLTSDDDDDDEFDPRTATTASTCPEGGNDDLADDMLSQNRLVNQSGALRIRVNKSTLSYHCHGNHIISPLHRTNNCVKIILSTKSNSQLISV